MEAALGDGYEVIEEGLNGRCTVWDSPSTPGRNGLDYLLPCLLSHAPVDLVIIMLGTNDLKRIYGVTAAEIACGAAGWSMSREAQPGRARRTCRRRCCWCRRCRWARSPRSSEMWGFGEARDESKQLAGMYAIVAEDHGVGLLRCRLGGTVHPDDGVHLDAAACASLGAAMAEAVRGRVRRRRGAVADVTVPS